MAFGLAVYASPDGLPAYDARLASGRWSSSTGRAFHPQDSYERFQICILHFTPFPSLLGAITSTGVSRMSLFENQNEFYVSYSRLSTDPFPQVYLTAEHC